MRNKVEINTSIVIISVIMYNVGMYVNSLIYEYSSHYLILYTIFLICIYLACNNSSTIAISKNIKNILEAIAALLLIASLNYLFTGNIEGIFMFTIYMLVLGLLIDTKLNKLTIKTIFTIFMVIYIAWMFRIENYYDYFMIQLYTYGVNNVLNSNTVGQIIVILSMVLYAIICHWGICKIFGYTILLGGIWGCMSCQTRSGTCALIFFCTLVINIKRLLKKPQLKKSILKVFATVYWMGAIFPFVLVYILKNITMLHGKDILGKGIYTGREKMWSELFELIEENKLGLIIGYGHYSGFNYLTESASNIHSWYLRIIFLYGISGLLIIFVLYYSLLKRACNRTMTESRLVLIASFISICIICYFEISLSYYSLAMLCNFPLALACNMYFDKDYGKKNYFCFNGYKKLCLARSYKCY